MASQRVRHKVGLLFIHLCVLKLQLCYL
jgi:hypothetical protein